jgi:hypothetical protein
MPYLIPLIFSILLTACGPEAFEPSYKAVTPPIPALWMEILGEPAWRLEWINPAGALEIQEIPPGKSLKIQVLSEWATPILAYPFWPGRGLGAEILRPAGGIFPFDAEGDSILLTWPGGIDGVLYQSLGRFGKEKRQAPYFNWVKFRELRASETLPEAVRQDPWVVDWPAFAEKTGTSGFDRRRIRPKEQVIQRIPVSFSGFWLGTSPFAPAIPQSPGEDLALPVPGTYFSSLGLLRCTPGAWMLIPW